ncbi:hypothetical protein [Actinokineospora sp.]|uniref:hypothetical protein n=1 Tax=Actinokineospora sp. TaxID=1872133 RepID=UPI003D6A64A1
MTQPDPEFRLRVRALAESQWREPVVVIHLGEVKPDFDVPGRRKDGTVIGKRLVRRFFWNLFRGTVGSLVNVVLSVAGGGVGNVFERSGKVTGPENAQALGLVDAARPADSAWLVFSQSQVAMIDSGRTFVDPKDSPPPTILWHATTPDAPRVTPRKRIVWPDGSAYEYVLSYDEAKLLKQLTLPEADERA